jgi:hypothetical protein
VRIVGATLASAASLAWATERFTETPNYIANHLQNNADYSIWIVFVLATFTIFYTITIKSTKKVGIPSKTIFSRIIAR